jgi:pyruvate dehydrogenase E2 component (dihydrolipoamide acetyltransferase)
VSWSGETDERAFQRAWLRGYGPRPTEELPTPTEEVMEEIFVPASGMAMEDVLFTEWLKQPGDEVAPGEPVAVVETDKSTVELSGTTAGRLSRHLVEAGARVPGGTTVAYLLAQGESEPGTAGAAGEAGHRSAVKTAQRAVPAGLRSRRTNGEAPGQNGEPSGPEREEREADGRHRLSPRQRRAMAETAATGATTRDAGDTGPAVDGRRPAKEPLPTAAQSDRKATAALVTESWRTVPHFSVGRDLRVDGLLEAVSAGKAAGQGLTVTDFFLVALAQALESSGETSDVGLAVATQWGVLIPVVPSVARLSLPEVAKQREAAVARARNRRLASADAAPVFSTLSNLGPSGVTWFTGVVPVNQVALLTVGEISLRPAVEGRGLVVAPMLTAIVTADHRRYDGVDSAKLLSAFAENLRDSTERASTGRASTERGRV